MVDHTDEKATIMWQIIGLIASGITGSFVGVSAAIGQVGITLTGDLLFFVSITFPCLIVFVYMISANKKAPL